jgi:DNA-binding NarL/FixJ family response regulator
MSEPITVILVDDHTLFRQGLRELLTSDGSLEVVAEGATGAEAVRLARQHRPDVVVLDVQMPGQPARRTVQQLKSVVPSTSVIILTMHDDAETVRELLDLGASGYLVKNAERQELVSAILSAARTQDDTVTLMVSRRTMNGLDGGDEAVLSPREREVLRLLAMAKSNAQIAAELFIAEGTVKRHLTNVYAKLGAVSRMDALHKASAAGLVSGW